MTSYPKVLPPSPINPAELKVGGYAFLGPQKIPCKLEDVNHHKEGKHGTMKITLTGFPIAWSPERDDEISASRIQQCMSGSQSILRFEPVKKILAVSYVSDDTIDLIIEKGKPLLSLPWSPDESPYLSKLLELDDEIVNYEVGVIFYPSPLDDDDDQEDEKQNVFITHFQKIKQLHKDL